MGWLNVSFPCRAASSEALCDALLDAGALSAAIEDADRGTAAETPQFGEPGMDLSPQWENSRVIALFADDAPVAHMVENAFAALADTPHAYRVIPTYAVEMVAEENWVEKTQAQFAPIAISPRLWIVPSWHEAPDPQAVNLVLDPGMAFGTGSHPTTHLCLNWLEATLQGGESLLDYGCGSGILALAAAKFGARNVWGVDIDPQALIAARANAESNGVELVLHDSNTPLTEQQQFDVVVANILANPLRVLAPMLCRHVRAGGKLALSGLLAEQAEEIAAIYEPWIQLSVFATLDGWVCLSGQKRTH